MSLVTCVLDYLRSVVLVHVTVVLVTPLTRETFTYHNAHLLCRRSTRLASKRGSGSSTNSLESSRTSVVSDPGERTDTETRVRGDTMPGEYPE